MRRCFQSVSKHGEYQNQSEDVSLELRSTHQVAFGLGVHIEGLMTPKVATPQRNDRRLSVYGYSVRSIEP